MPIGWMLAGMAVAGGDEQALAWAINCARSDPAAWAAARGLDALIGGDGRPTTLEDVPPRPPLGFSALLTDPARLHASEMSSRGYFGHESPVDGSWPNQRLRDAGYALAAQVPTADGSIWRLEDRANNVESLAAGQPDALAALDDLLVDAGANPPTHRDHLLGGDEFFATHREIGVGQVVAPGSAYGTYWTVETGLVDPADQVLTGVVYDDLDGNGAYDAGEGLAGVDLTVGAEALVSGGDGAWALLAPDGGYAVTCSGDGFVGFASGTVPVEGASREVDFRSGYEGMDLDFAPVDAPAEAFGCATTGTPVGWLALAGLGVRRRRVPSAHGQALGRRCARDLHARV
jgi:hypothetical protein